MIGENFNIGPLGMMGLSILGNAYGPNSRNAIGQGAMQGLLMHQQMQGADQMQKIRQMQLDEMKRKFEDQDAARAVLQDVYAQRGLPKSSPPDGQAPTPAGLSRSSAAAFGAPEFATPDVPTMASGSVAPKAQVWQQYRAIGDAMSGRGLTVQAQQYYDMAEKFRPKFKADSRTVRMPDGRIATVNMSEDGNEVVSGYAPAEKLNFQNLGSQTVGLDPYSGHQVAAMRNTMSPDAVASNAVAWANNRLSADRLGFDKSQAYQPRFNADAGGFIIPPSAQAPSGAVVPLPGFSKPLGEGQKKQLTGIESLNGAIGEYLTELESWGNAKMLLPDARAKMGTKYNNMMLQAKEAYNLGVLNGPDYDILQSVIADPASLKSAFVSKDALATQAKDLRRMMGETADAVRAGGAKRSSMDAGGWSATVVK